MTPRRRPFSGQSRRAVPVRPTAFITDATNLLADDINGSDSDVWTYHRPTG